MIQRTSPNSIEKALKILTAFTPYNAEMGSVELSQKLGFHKATVHRILLILARHGFLQKNPFTRKFMLGPTSADIGRAVTQSLSGNLIHAARPYIENLRNAVRETVVLEVFSGKNTIIADIAEGPQPVRIAGTVGSRLPIHAAAGGKTILAFSPQETVNSLLDGELPRFTLNTIIVPDMLKRQLEKIRKEGVAFDCEEIDVGINAVGAPIFDYDGRPVGAVVIAGPTQRVKHEGEPEMVGLLKKTAAGISSRLLYRREKMDTRIQTESGREKGARKLGGEPRR